MNAPQGPAAPASGTAEHVPTFEELAADPEIAALLDFAPVPRLIVKANGWTPGMQRMFIAWLAWYGSPTNACDELGMARSGADKLYKAAGSEEFRAAWDGAIALFERRRIARTVSRHAGAGALRAPTVSRKSPSAFAGEGRGEGAPGQILNEYDEWEDEASVVSRAEDARDSISGKLRRSRRLYLQEISDSPGKRAAFEILTDLPIDWDKARRLEPQEDEPWRRPNLREGDMLLTAENGWLGGAAHGPDKMAAQSCRGRGEQRTAELRRAVDEHRAGEGLEPVDWDGE